MSWIDSNERLDATSRPVLDPIQSPDSVKSRVRQSSYVYDSYHERAEKEGSSKVAGYSDKFSGGKPMRLRDSGSRNSMEPLTRKLRILV